MEWTLYLGIILGIVVVSLMICLCYIIIKYRKSVKFNQHGNLVGGGGETNNFI